MTIRKSLASLSLPNVTPFTYTIWMSVRRGFVSVSNYPHDILMGSLEYHRPRGHRLCCPSRRHHSVVRWQHHNPPYDLIVSTFEACFDSTKQLYPGVRDRAYFSARAILQIYTGAKFRSHDQASKYPIPTVSSSQFNYADPDLHHIIPMFEHNSGSRRPTLDFLKGGINTRRDLLWMSNLFVDLTRIGQNPVLGSYESYLSIAATDHQTMITNTLVMRYMFLGGHVEEETFWAVDESYVPVLLLFLPTCLAFCMLAIHWNLSFPTCPQG